MGGLGLDGYIRGGCTSCRAKREIERESRRAALWAQAPSKGLSQGNIAANNTGYSVAMLGTLGHVLAVAARLSVAHRRG